MAPEATPQRSAASMNYDNHQSMGASADQRSRMGITREAQRATAGPAVVNFYAKQNPAINVERTHLNIDRVNDGAGGFRPTASIGEVVAYGDERVAKISPALKSGNRFAVTTVGQLPWAYCEPDGTEYQVVDKQGRSKFWPGGEPMMQPRYRVKRGMEDEAARYFDEWLKYQAELLPGGQEGMHGYSINMDETRPHIQLLSDPFEANPSKKSPDALKNGYSRAFGSHPKDDLVPMLDRSGRPALGDDGEPRLVREGAGRKMERYQRQLRERMVALGFEVDLERDEQRHNRHLALPDYKELEQSKTVVRVRQADLGAALADAESVRLDVAAVVEAVEVEKFSEFAEARSSGYTAGVTAGVQAGRAQAQTELDAAAAARTAAEDERTTAEQKTEAAEAARQAAAAHEAARAEAKEKVEAEAAAAAEAREAATADRDAAAADRAKAKEAREEAESRTVDLDAAIADLSDREVDAQASYLIKALRQDRSTFAGGSALDHYVAEGTALIKRERGLGRMVNARETEGERKTRMAEGLGHISSQVKEVNANPQTQESDQTCEQD